MVVRRFAEDPDAILTTRARARALASLARCCKDLRADVDAIGWPALSAARVGPKATDACDRLRSAELAVVGDDTARQMAGHLGIAPCSRDHIVRLRTELVRRQQWIFLAPAQAQLQTQLAHEAEASRLLTLAEARDRFSLRPQDVRAQVDWAGGAAFTELDAHDACHTRFGSEAAWRRHHERARRVAEKRRVTRRDRDERTQEAGDVGRAIISPAVGRLASGFDRQALAARWVEAHESAHVRAAADAYRATGGPERLAALKRAYQAEADAMEARQATARGRTDLPPANLMFGEWIASAMDRFVVFGDATGPDGVARRWAAFRAAWPEPEPEPDQQPGLDPPDAACIRRARTDLARMTLSHKVALSASLEEVEAYVRERRVLLFEIVSHISSDPRVARLGAAPFPGWADPVVARSSVWNEALDAMPAPYDFAAPPAEAEHCADRAARRLARQGVRDAVARLFPGAALPRLSGAVDAALGRDLFCELQGLPDDAAVRARLEEAVRRVAIDTQKTGQHRCSGVGCDRLRAGRCPNSLCGFCCRSYAISCPAHR
jgi:hypothetical protein